jgi:CBS domain-containing protein
MSTEKSLEIQKKILAGTRLLAVRADTSILSCVSLMRANGVGSLLVLSDNAREELVGIFTERDLLKHLEVIHHGNFLEHPVRTVMTSPVKTVSADKILEAGEIMLRHGIRHLPIVSEEKGKKRLVGVVSMRDLFQLLMEAADGDLRRLAKDPPARAKTKKNRLVGILSSDASLTTLLSHVQKLTGHLLVKVSSSFKNFDAFLENLDSFDAVILDLDGLGPLDWENFLRKRREEKPKLRTLALFNPVALPERMKKSLISASGESLVLVSKPLPVGILMEKFLKKV